MERNSCLVATHQICTSRGSQHPQYHRTEPVHTILFVSDLRMAYLLPEESGIPEFEFSNVTSRTPGLTDPQHPDPGTRAWGTQSGSFGDLLSDTKAKTPGR